MDSSSYAGEGIPRVVPPDDRRKATRYACEGFAEIVGSEIRFLFRGEIQNLSQSGCYIQSRAPLKLQKNIDVQLHFTVEGANYDAMARIMVVEPGIGAGFQFLSIDLKNKTNIAHLLEKLQREQG